jgi:uncharacterized FlaG/YvyC family protein
MSSINNLNTSSFPPSAQGPITVPIASTASKNEISKQPSDISNQFNDFQKIVQKSSEQLDNNRRKLEQAVQELKRTADTAGRALGFRIDPAISGAIVTVSNLDTGQVIRQIPEEVVVRVAHSIEKMKGLLFDGKL